MGAVQSSAGRASIPFVDYAGRLGQQAAEKPICTSRLANGTQTGQAFIVQSRF